jgi:hypothetical protein
MSGVSAPIDRDGPAGGGKEHFPETAPIMRITTQNLLAIIPVFIVLALGISGLLCYLEHQETLWGLKEQTGALAVTIAEMVEPEVIERFDEGNSSTEGTRVITRLTGVLFWETSDRIFCCDAARHRCLFDINPRGLVPEAAGLCSVASDTGTVLQKIAGWGNVVTALQPIMAGGKKDTCVGYIGVQSDARILKLQLKQNVRSGLFKIGAACGVGAFCAILLSWLLGRRIKLLADAAVLASRGEYHTLSDSQLGSIREINDLGSAFNTMISIMKDIMARNKKRLSQVEQHQSPRETAIAIASAFWKHVTIVRDTTSFTIKTVGELKHGVFAELFETETDIFCCFGRIQSGRDIYGTIEAAAALRYLKALVRHSETIQALRKTSSLFTFRELTLIGRHADESVVHVYELAENTGVFREREETIPAGQPLLFHTFEPEMDSRLRLFSKEFTSKMSAESIDEFLQLA